MKQYVTDGYEECTGTKVDIYASKWFSSDATQSEVDTYLSTRGGGYHFKTLSGGAMNYQFTDI